MASSFRGIAKHLTRSLRCDIVVGGPILTKPIGVVHMAKRRAPKCLDKNTKPGKMALVCIMSRIASLHHVSPVTHLFCGHTLLFQGFIDLLALMFVLRQGAQNAPWPPNQHSLLILSSRGIKALAHEKSGELLVLWL